MNLVDFEIQSQPKTNSLLKPIKDTSVLNYNCKHFKTSILSLLIISEVQKVDPCAFSNNSLKYLVFWRSSFLKPFLYPLFEPLFWRPRITYIDKLFLKIYFYIHFLCPYFDAPGSQNGLKLKDQVDIDELYDSLKNWSFCIMFKKNFKGPF